MKNTKTPPSRAGNDTYKNLEKLFTPGVTLILKKDYQRSLPGIRKISGDNEYEKKGVFDPRARFYLVSHLLVTPAPRVFPTICKRLTITFPNSDNVFSRNPSSTFIISNMKDFLLVSTWRNANRIVTSFFIPVPNRIKIIFKTIVFSRRIVIYPLIGRHVACYGRHYNVKVAFREISSRYVSESRQFHMLSAYLLFESIRKQSKISNSNQPRTFVYRVEPSPSTM